MTVIFCGKRLTSVRRHALFDGAFLIADPSPFFHELGKGKRAMAEATTYDEIPYLTAPLYCAHPDFVATKATIFGMTPAPPARCRVLELGCGTGVNLLAMAQALPESRFVGIDL